jgi:hypothetical protein
MHLYSGVDMRGDGKHRHARAMAIEQAVDEMQVTRPATAGAHRELSGQMRLDPCGERTRLFIANVHPSDLALPTNGIGDAVERVADDRIDPFDARRSEGLDELVGDIHGLAPAVLTGRATDRDQVGNAPP